MSLALPIKMQSNCDVCWHRFLRRADGSPITGSAKAAIILRQNRHRALSLLFAHELVGKPVLLYRIMR